VSAAREPHTGLEEIRTERMTGERLRNHDGDALGGIIRDPRVARTLFPGGPPDAAETQRILERHVEHWDRNGFGLWLLRDVRSGAVVGRGGLLRQTIALAWERLGLDELISFTLTTNTASRRVMEKAGLAYERDIEHVSLPHVLYRLRRC
jgi:ribosomal-protein-alanine N-acetyltransferase